ncbi:MAG: sensor histidine kinase, partial [Chloroflexi bacterium]|nr:sensor histidine kinase [Chloroflexota bacterium]
RALDGLRPRRFDLVLVGAALLMTLVTVILAADVDMRLVIVDRTLDVAVTSLAALAATGLAVFTIPRYQESGRLSLLLQASAFVLGATFSGLTVALVLTKLDAQLGMTLGVPEQLPLYVTAVTRLIIGVLFLVAGLAAVRRIRSRVARPRTVLLAPVLLVLGITVIAYPLRDLLAPLIDEDGIRLLLSDTSGTGRLNGITPLAIGAVVVTVLVLMAAAILFRFSYVERGSPSDGFLAVGLVITAFTELQSAFYPSVYTGLVTTSDMLRLVAYAVLLLGIGAEQRADLRALRLAYTALDRLRVTEAERAALEERSRLAREIHDGLAQHLWFAKLKFERLAASVPDEDRPLAGEVGQALDSAIVEARQALVTMRTSLDADLPLSEMLTRTVDDFAQRSDLRVTFSASPGLPTALPPRQQIEQLRIVQEALTNVRKHADATVARVRADIRGRDMILAISDNGKGFDPATASDQGLGIQGMEERARLLGGTLKVTSEPQGGTTIEVVVPLLVPDWLPFLEPEPLPDIPWEAVETRLDQRPDDAPTDPTSVLLPLPTPDARAPRPLP